MLSHQYDLYGLRIESNIELAGLTGCRDNKPADITICQQPEIQVPVAESTRFLYSRTLEDGSIYLQANEVCRAQIRPREGLIQWEPGRHTHAEAAQAYVLAAGLSYCLIARGIEPTHGTALLVNGEAIALIGDSGYGKSTLAAGFVAAGHPLITDDMLILQRRGQRWMVLPGAARLKLYPAVRDALLPGNKAVRMNPFTDKEVMLLDGVSQPAPLRTIYLLPRVAAQAKQIRFRRVTPRAAFFALLRNTFSNTPQHAERLKNQFEFATAVSASMPVRAVRYPKLLERVPEVVRAICEDAGCNRLDSNGNICAVE